MERVASGVLGSLGPVLPRASRTNPVPIRSVVLRALPDGRGCLDLSSVMPRD